MADLIVDEVMLREPNLLIPRKKPVGRVKLNPEYENDIYAAYLFQSVAGIHRSLKGDKLTLSASVPVMPITTQYGEAGDNPPPNHYYSATTHKKETNWSREVLFTTFIQGRQALAITAESPGNLTRDRAICVTTARFLEGYVFDGAAQYVVGTTLVSNGDLVHGIITLGPSGFKLYTNGILEDTDSGVTTAYTGTTTPELVIGYGDSRQQAYSCYSRFFFFIDWDVELTATQVSDRYKDLYGFTIPA